MADKRPWRRAFRIAGAVGVVVVLAATARDLAGGSSSPSTVSSGRNPLTPSPSAPSASSDPSAHLLAGLVVADSDVAPALTVAGLQGGNGLTQPTLDLCNGTFPSETMRTARLQVAAVDGQGNTVLSTEAVLYSSGAGTAAAFNELQKVAAACPSGPVDSPVGEPTVTTHISPAPDAGWPEVASVERLAFSYDIIDTSGETSHYMAVFLRRGRALLGIYFSRPEAPPSVQGRTTLPDIVNAFATRLAKLPIEAVSTTA